MFTLHKWPAKRRKTKLSGRPRRPDAYNHPRTKILNHIENLYEKELLTTTEFYTAQWFMRTWARNLRAIQAPAVKTSLLDPSTLKGKTWSDKFLEKIESDWRLAKSVYTRQSPETRSIVNQTLLNDGPCADVRSLKRFLMELDAFMQGRM